MLAAIAAAVVVCAAALVIGQAVLAAAGWREWSPLSAGVGFAALLVLCGLGGRAVVLVAAVAVAVVYLVTTVKGPGPSLGRAGRRLEPG